MYIDRTNDNRLEVLINMEDLENNNISLEDFMIDSQNLYPYILDTIFEKTNFRLNNYKIKIDSFFIMSKKIFVLIITRFSKLIGFNKNYKYKNNIYLTAQFNDLNNLCALCLSFNISTSSSLYYYNNYYYLKVKVLHMSDYKKTYYSIKEFTDCINSSCCFNRKIYDNLIIDTHAIEILKSYI